MPVSHGSLGSVCMACPVLSSLCQHDWQCSSLGRSVSVVSVTVTLRWDVVETRNKSLLLS